MKKFLEKIFSTRVFSSDSSECFFTSLSRRLKSCSIFFISKNYTSQPNDSTIFLAHMLVIKNHSCLSFALIKYTLSFNYLAFLDFLINKYIFYLYIILILYNVFLILNAVFMPTGPNIDDIQNSFCFLFNSRLAITSFLYFFTISYTYFISV